MVWVLTNLNTWAAQAACCCLEYTESSSIFSTHQQPVPWYMFYDAHSETALTALAHLCYICMALGIIETALGA